MLSIRSLSNKFISDILCAGAVWACDMNWLQTSTRKGRTLEGGGVRFKANISPFDYGSSLAANIAVPLYVASPPGCDVQRPSVPLSAGEAVEVEPPALERHKHHMNQVKVIIYHGHSAVRIEREDFQRSRSEYYSMNKSLSTSTLKMLVWLQSGWQHNGCLNHAPGLTGAPTSLKL